MNEENGLPRGWAWTTLGDVLPIQYGKGLVEAVRDSNGQVPVYGSSGIVGFHNQALTSKATLIIGRKGSIGSVHYSPRPCWPIDTTYFVEESANVDIKFFLYLLSFLKLDQLDKSTAVPGLSRDDYNTVAAPIAPLPEQQRIVAAIEQQFSRLDAGVAALRRAQAKLKRYRAAVLKAAVEGKLTEDWRAEHPATEPAYELLERILVERRAKWEADLRAKGKDPAKVRYVEPAKPDVESLPKLPEGWCWATVEQVTSRSEYGTSIKCDYEAKGVPVLRIPNIAAGEIDLGDMKYSVQSLDIDQDSALQSGDILVCRTNGSVSLIGKAALIRVPLEPYHTFASYLLRFRLFEASILPRWLHLYVSSPQGRAFIESNAASSAGQHNISLTLMHSMRFPVPPLTEQEQIVAEVEQRLSVVSQLEATVEANLKRAERLRQSILREAFAGRLVPQDPNDEPASVLLGRIRGDHEKRKYGTANKGRVVNGAVGEPVKIDVSGTRQVELWESVGSGE